MTITLIQSPFSLNENICDFLEQFSSYSVFLDGLRWHPVTLIANSGNGRSSSLSNTTWLRRKASGESQVRLSARPWHNWGR